MSNLLSLIKVNLRETFDKRKFKQNKKQLSFFIYMGLLGLLFIGLSTMYSVIYGMSYNASGNLDLLYTLTISFFIVSTMVVFSSTIAKMQSIFKGNDYDLLSSMPIKKSDIVLSKVLYLYFSEVLICLVLIIPNAFVSLVFTQDFRYLLMIPLSFITPAYPMLLSLMITSILELIIKNPKIKNIINTVIMLGLVSLIVIASFIFSSSGEGNLTALFTNLSNSSIYVNPSLYFLVNSFTDNLVWTLAYVGSNLLLLIIVLGIVTLAYTKIHNSMTTTSLPSQKRKGTISYKYISSKRVIFNSTAKQFFKSRVSLIQCGVGILMSIIFTIIIVVGINNLDLSKTISLFGEDVTLESLVYSMGFLFPVFLSLFLGMVPPSAFAVSLEGKNFFILKSIPLSFKDYLKAKLLFSIVFLSTSSLITSLIYVIFVHQSIISIITSIVFPQLFVVFVSLFTLIINSLFPYFNWKEELEVYKNHKSTLITTFSDMGISIITSTIAIILALIMPLASSIAIITIYLAIDIVLYCILINKISKKLEVLEVAD